MVAAHGSEARASSWDYRGRSNRDLVFGRGQMNASSLLYTQSPAVVVQNENKRPGRTAATLTGFQERQGSQVKAAHSCIRSLDHHEMRNTFWAAEF